jgi:hypothetical protein
MKLMLTVVLSILLAGCGQKQATPRQVVILIDMSASIEPQAETECLDAIAKLISKLERGDIVAIIPITGDTEIQSTGHILRFRKPVTRTAYDADLIGFSKQVHDSLQALRIEAISNPTAKTDILGAIRMAMEELTSPSKERDKKLIIFSDFIEDDGTVNFKNDSHFQNETDAVKYANELATVLSPKGMSGTMAYLGLLRSKEFGQLSKRRREAIKSFWRQYLESLGMNERLVSDGIHVID